MSSRKGSSQGLFSFLFIANCFFLLRISSTHGQEILDECFNNAVGFAENSAIPDNQMTASSIYGDLDQPYYGRLNGTRGYGWCANKNDSTPWLQVDLGKAFAVCGVATQGSTSGFDWTTHFKLSFSSDGNTWTTYQDENGNEVEFVREGRAAGIDHHKLAVPVPARHTRFHPTDYSGAICLRVEVYGIADPEYQFEDLEIRVSESSGFATIVIENIGNKTVTTELSVTTSDVNATHGQDYIGLNYQQVSFLPGDTSKEVNTTILDDDVVEGEESFEVYLQLVSSSDPNATLGERTTLTVIIEDNDGVQPTDPPVSVDNSTSSPCLNQGTCETFDNCTSSPCLSQGTCNRYPGGYNCSCGAEFYGDNCETFDNCTSSPCLNQGTCNRYPGGYNCSCQAEYYGDICETFDNCSSSPCLNQGTCNRYPGGYNCSCQAEFYGDSCETFDNCTNSPCRNQGTCNRYPGGYNCSCQAEYYGDNCETFDNCTTSPCLNQGTCNRYPGGYNCSCPPEYFGDNCETFDNCTSSPCLNQGTCNRYPGGYNCSCQAEFYGDNCETYDNCTSSPCRNNGTCSRYPGGYNCTCQAGFYGDNCEIIDNCTSSPCRNNGNCTRFPGGYNCTCQPEFYGYNCETFDNCTSSPCHNNGNCTRYPGGYNCGCESEFYANNCET